MLKKPTIIQTLAICLSCKLFTFHGSAQALSDKTPEQLNDGWIVTKPSEQGFDSKQLAALTQRILSGDIHNIHSLLIEHDGKLIYEEYFSGPDQKLGVPFKNDITFNNTTFHDIRSVTKSITSAALGIALKGQYTQALDKPVASYFPELHSQLGEGADAVTLKHALTMTAGLDWNEMTVPYSSAENDEVAMYSTQNPAAMVLGRNRVTPAGSQWYYNGGLAQVVAGIISKETGQSLDEYVNKVLFQPLGIKDYEWMGPPHWESPSAAAGLRLRARDMAKIGSLYLHNGQWRGEQIVPSQWVALSTQHSVKTTPWGDGFADYGYGFMWFPGLLKDNKALRIIRALGWGGQAIFILPELKLSVSVFAGNYRGEGRGNNAKILNAILAAQ